MPLTIQMFGQFAHELKVSSITVDKVNTSFELEQSLKALHPVFSRIPWRIAVNRRLISGATELKEDDEIAILPPFSGG